MARWARIEFPGAIYHVINRGNDRRDVFDSAGSAGTFVAVLTCRSELLCTSARVDESSVGQSPFNGKWACPWSGSPPLCTGEAQPPSAPAFADFDAVKHCHDMTRQFEPPVIDCTDGLCSVLGMPSKTISLEVDAYNRLKASRRAGESFSEVVRRITLPPAKATAADLLAEMKAGTFGRGVEWTAVKRAVAGRRRSRDLRAT